MSGAEKGVGAQAPKRTFRRRLYHRMYDWGWTRVEADNTLRSRMAHGLGETHRWYDWGHMAMWLVGRYDSGSAGVPRGRDMWWVPVSHVERVAEPWMANFEKRHGCYVTRRYEDVRDTQGLYVSWNIFDLQDDGTTVVIGRWPSSPDDDGRIQRLVGGMSRRQVRLFLRWYLWEHKAKAQWFGIRRWVYYKALHSVVNDKRPFSCQRTPDKGAGGYSHWHCQLRKRHKGEHRFRNYTWGGADARVEYAPRDEVSP